MRIVAAASATTRWYAGGTLDSMTKSIASVALMTPTRRAIPTRTRVPVWYDRALGTSRNTVERQADINTARALRLPKGAPWRRIGLPVEVEKNGNARRG